MNSTEYATRMRRAAKTLHRRAQWVPLRVVGRSTVLTYECGCVRTTTERRTAAADSTRVESCVDHLTFWAAAS